VVILKISKLEKQWLNSLRILKCNRQFKIYYQDTYYIADGYDPYTNTLYEFNGDFWHGNPKKYNAKDINPISKIAFGTLYNQTIEKQKILRSLGYNVVSIWESDFVKYQQYIKKAKKRRKRRK